MAHLGKKLSAIERSTITASNQDCVVTNSTTTCMDSPHFGHVTVTVLTPQQ